MPISCNAIIRTKIREKAGVIRMHVLDFNEELHNRSLIEYGREQGIEQGIEQTKEQILVNLIKSDKLSDEDIASCTGCPIEQVIQLRDKLDSGKEKGHKKDSTIDG